jgi:hypothetical protein
MPPYRVSSDDDSVHIVVLPSTFWIRFRVNLYASRAGIAVGVGIGTALALVITSFGLAVDADADVAEPAPWALLGTIFVGAWLAAAGLPLAFFLVRLIWVSSRPSPLEQMLPSAITMRDDGLVVTEQSGKVQAVRWSWLAGARDLGETLELSLAHDNHVKLFLTREDGIDLARVRRWLVDHQLLR